MINKVFKGFAGRLLLMVSFVLLVPMGKVWAAPEEISLPLIQAGDSTVLNYGSYSCLAFTLLL